MKYKYSITEFGEYDDKSRKVNIYSICSRCRKPHKGSYGFEASWASRGEFGFMRIKLCRKCVKYIMPFFKDALMQAYKDTHGQNSSL